MQRMSVWDVVIPLGLMKSCLESQPEAETRVFKSSLDSSVSPFCLFNSA